MEQNTKKLVKFYVWLAFGILLSLMVSMMKASGHMDIHAFFYQGKTYEFSEKTLQKSGKGFLFQENTGTFLIEGDAARKSFPSIKEEGEWHYIYFTIANMNQPTAEMRFRYYDQDGQALGDQYCTAVQGPNLLEIQFPENLDRFRISIRGQQGLSFQMVSMELKESIPTVPKMEMLKTAGISMACYFFLTLWIWMLRRMPKYAPVEALQTLYLMFGNACGKRIGFPNDAKKRSRVRTGLFFALFFFDIIYQSQGLFLSAKTYRYGILVNVALLILIALFSWERELKAVKWDSAFPTVWFFLWAWVCLSDLFARKRFAGVGTSFLLGVGFFFFLWNQMERPKQMRNDMVRGLECTFVPVVLYCMVCRQRIQGISYNGIYQGRYDMALYALAMWIVFLAKLRYYESCPNAKERGKWLFAYAAGAALSAYFLFQTRVWGCAVAAVVALPVFFRKGRERRRPPSRGRAKTHGGLRESLPPLVGCVLLVCLVHVATGNLPELLHTNLIYEKDCYEIKGDRSDQLAWEEKAPPEIYAHIQPAFSSNWKAIWKDCLYSWNLYGHEAFLMTYEKKTMAYNGILEMAYRYGLFVLVPYSALLLLCLYYAFQEGGCLMLAITLGFETALLTQNIEQPFAHPLWILFYLGMGEWFVCKSKEPMGRRMQKAPERGGGEKVVG